MIVTLAFLYPAIDNGWVNWDDERYIGRNPLILDFSITNALALFSPENRVMDTYTPFTLVAYSLQYAAWGKSPMGYHLLSVLLHVACSLLVFVFVNRLTKKENLAFIVALIFGLHPMNMESVAWISGQKDLWCGIFFLLGLIYYLGYVGSKPEGKKWLSSKPFWLSFLFFVLAILSKPIALPFPFILLGLDGYCRRKIDKQVLIEKVPFLAVSLLIFLLSLSLADQSEMAVPLFDRVFLSAKAASLYSLKLLLPTGLSAFHPMIERASVSSLDFFSALPLLVAVYGALAWFFRKDRLAIFSLFFFAVLLLIGLPLFKVHKAIIFERFVYLASIGFILFICHAIQSFVEKRKLVSGHLLFGLGVVVAIGFGIMSFHRVQVWKNDLSLFSDVAKKYPSDYLAHSLLGHYYSTQNQPAKALEEYNLALKDYPEEYETLNNRGMLYMMQKAYEEAFQDFSAAIQYHPQYYSALLNRAFLSLNTNRTELALSDLNKAEKIDSSDFKLYYNRGLAYERLQAPDKALTDLRRASRLDPENVYILRDLGRLELDNGLLEEAEAHLSAAIRLAPDFALAYYLRSIGYAKAGDKNAALSDALKARELGFQVREEYLQELIPKTASPK